MDGKTSEISHKKKTIFLFKSPKENETDRFSESLEGAGMSCSTIPVLAFRFVNQSELKCHLSAIHLFSAIIFTSVRAVEAVANLLKEFDDARQICQVQSFVVGHGTAEAAKKVGFYPKGEHTGNAQALAEFILKEVGTENANPLLYPCSNIHRDTLKDVLNHHGVPLTEVTAYETCPNEKLKEALHKAIQEQGVPDHAVFFSPSGFQFTLTEADKEQLPLEKIKIIALGPATHKSICEHGFLPWGMAEKPEPSSLLELLS